MEFRPMNEAPATGEQILCRFWQPYEKKWVYGVAWASGEDTTAVGYALFEEWTYLPQNEKETP